MILFLLTFLFLYGGIHFYAFMRARSIFHFPPVAQTLIVVLFLLLIFAPALVRIAESRQLETLARFIAYVGYVWMAFIFLFFVLNVSFDLFKLIIKFFSGTMVNVSYNKITFGLAAFFSFVLVFYGFIDACAVRVKKLEVCTSQELANNGKIRVVQISDVHIGLIIKEKRLQAVIDKVNEADPDILVSTGDLLDGEINNIMPLAQLLSSIKPKYGKYAITGNHEYYAGIDASLKFTRKAGFEVLRDEIRQVAGINIVGIDDITGRKSVIINENSRITKTMPPLPDDKFVLLLKHQPYVNKNDRFNLQLSGHTHGGQIFPFRLITRLFFENNYGHYELGQDKQLYVSRGTGTWGPPVRVFAPPEITVIDIIGKNSN
jgi:predicted MPP superfamily phosphohydrolase